MGHCDIHTERQALYARSQHRLCFFELTEFAERRAGSGIAGMALGKPRSYRFPALHGFRPVSPRIRDPAMICRYLRTARETQGCLRQYFFGLIQPARLPQRRTGARRRDFREIFP